MKQVEVRIMGQTYLLGCHEEAERNLMEAVNIVDKEMCNIRDSGKVKTRERIAVLAALNIAVNLTQEKASAQQTPQKTISHYSGSTQDIDCEDLIERIDTVLHIDGRLL